MGVFYVWFMMLCAVKVLFHVFPLLFVLGENINTIFYCILHFYNSLQSPSEQSPVPKASSPHLYSTIETGCLRTFPTIPEQILLGALGKIPLPPQCSPRAR